ncbi:unnamed protein product [Heterobilharzia americana]|nr:unnamed protein product [Heterobilharzia americana]
MPLHMSLMCFYLLRTSFSCENNYLCLPLVPQNTVSAGQLLCGGLFSNDSSTWFCAIALLHCIHDNVRLKEELLRVHLTPNEGVGPVTLFHQCFIWQQQSNRFQTRMGLLQLLCTWFTSCSQAITYFLNSTNSRELSSSLNNPTEATNRGSYLSTLIAEVCAVDNDENEALIRGLTTLIICICVIYHPGNIHGFDKATLFTTLEKRIGIDMILERLSQVSKSESFVTASKKPQTHVHFADDLIFDYTFTRLFKRLEYEVMHTFQSDNYVNGLGTGISNDDNHRSIKSIEDAEMKLKLYEEKMIQYKDEIIMLRDRVSVMQSELNACHSIINSASTNIQQNNIVNEGHVQKIIMSDSTIQILEEKCSLLEKERNTMQAEQEDLLLLLNDQELKIIKLCKLVKELGGCVPKDIELDAATDSKLPDNDNQPVKENNNQSVPLFHTSFVTDFNQPQIPTTVSSYISGVLSDSFNNISMPSFYNPYNDNTSSTPHNNPDKFNNK